MFTTRNGQIIAADIRDDGVIQSGKDVESHLSERNDDGTISGVDLKVKFKTDGKVITYVVKQPRFQIAE